jgi:hypothetical protein
MNDSSSKIALRQFTSTFSIHPVQAMRHEAHDHCAAAMIAVMYL